MPYRVHYNVLYTFKIKYKLAPVYMDNLIIEYYPPRSLRSGTAEFLIFPRTRTKSCGERRFDKCTAALWNSLPVDIRHINPLVAFKKALKTHLFVNAYM